MIHIRCNRDVYITVNNEMCYAYQGNNFKAGDSIRVCIWQSPKDTSKRWFAELWRQGMSVSRYWGSVPAIQFWLFTQGLWVTTELQYDREFEVMVNDVAKVGEEDE